LSITFRDFAVSLCFVSRAEKDGSFLLLKTADGSVRIDMKRGKIIENF